MASLVRTDVQATPEEKYASDLREKVNKLRSKAWSDLSPEERDAVVEYLAYTHQLVAPGAIVK